jgi:hypothetical protein
MPRKSSPRFRGSDVQHLTTPPLRLLEGFDIGWGTLKRTPVCYQCATSVLPACY